MTREENSKLRRWNFVKSQFLFLTEWIRIFGMRIRIHEVDKYGSNLDPDPKRLFTTVLRIRIRTNFECESGQFFSLYEN